MDLCQAGPAQGGDGLLLGPLRRQAHLTVRHRHGADLQPLGRSPQRQAIHGLAEGRLGLRSGQLIEQAGLAIRAGIEAEVPQRALALLMQPAWHPHQPHPIAQVVLQGLAGHLDQILPLNQREQAPGGGGGNGISQRTGRGIRWVCAGPGGDLLP
jgi:hypothetical protein